MAAPLQGITVVEAANYVAGPSAGEYTCAVLTAAGLSKERIAELAAAGVLG